MKKLVLVAAACIAAWSIGACAEGVGVVDMKTIFSTSPKVKEIKAELSKQFNPEKANLEKMGAALQSEMADYQKHVAIMTPKDKAAKEASITAQETKFRAAQTKFQQDIFNAQNQRLTQFMDSVKSSVKVVAEKNKLDLVIPSNDVLYTKNNMDITKDVMADLK